MCDCENGRICKTCEDMDRAETDECREFDPETDLIPTNRMFKRVDIYFVEPNGEILSHDQMIKRCS